MAITLYSNLNPGKKLEKTDLRRGVAKDKPSE